MTVSWPQALRGGLSAVTAPPPRADPMISYLAAFLAALTNATSNALNRKAARDQPRDVQFRLALIRNLIRRRAWLIAAALMLTSFLLSAVALGTGQLAGVQLVIILELPMTLIIGSRLLRTQLSWQEWAGAAALTAGVIGLLALLDPQPGADHHVAVLTWILAAVANSGALAVVFGLAVAHRRPVAQAALLGIAAGLGYGMTAAFTKGFAGRFATDGVIGVISSWQLYATGAAGILSTWLLENAYHAGPLTAVQPGITLVDPLISTLWGVVAFGETVRGGPVLMLVVLPALVIAAGVVALIRSPRLQALQDIRPELTERAVTAGESAGPAAVTPATRPVVTQAADAPHRIRQ
jgi:drug/metabolite transporter (DMT)-like permease